MVEILCRVKEHGRIVGYFARDTVHGSEIWIPIQDVRRYKATNAKLDTSGRFIANAGSRIKTIDRNDKIELNKRRTSQIGKPRLIYNTSFGDLSLTQSKLLKSFDNGNILRLDKRSINMKITMKDLSCLTAVTGREYALFERNDRYIIIQGSEQGMSFSKQLTAEIINNRYSWVGHTHPGDDVLCLMPSDHDYNTLRVLGQKRSVIYNSVGMWETFGYE